MHRLTATAAGLALLLAACGDTNAPPRKDAPTDETGTTAGSEGPLNEKLAEKKAAGMKKMPDEVKQLFVRRGEDLAKTDLMAKALKTGAKAPAFSLKDAMGQEKSLEALLKEGPVVVTFYRGKW